MIRIVVIMIDKETGGGREIDDVILNSHKHAKKPAVYT